MTNIAFIHGRFPAGGAERVTIDIARYLHQFKGEYNISVYASRINESPELESICQYLTIKTLPKQLFDVRRSRKIIEFVGDSITEGVLIDPQYNFEKLGQLNLPSCPSEIVTGNEKCENILENKENNYLAAVCFGKEKSGVAFLDITTGEFFVAEGSDKYIEKLISSLAPKEIVYQRGCEERFKSAFGTKHYTYRLEQWVFSYQVNVENGVLTMIPESEAEIYTYRKQN